VTSLLRFLVVLLLAAAIAGCGRVPKIIVLEDPLSADEHVALGVAYERKGELAPAAREYGRALKKDGKSFRARLNLGNVRLAEKRYGEARREYLEALSLRPADPEATNNLAWAAILSGNDREEALRRVDAVLAAREAHPPPGDGLTPSLLDTRGVLLTRLARFAEAESAFEQAEAACLAPGDHPGTGGSTPSPACPESVLLEIRAHREELGNVRPSPSAEPRLIK
jgi:tetratricopeptide (TPR) repeat protein